MYASNNFLIVIQDLVPELCLSILSVNRSGVHGRLAGHLETAPQGIRSPRIDLCVPSTKIQLGGPAENATQSS